MIHTFSIKSAQFEIFYFAEKSDNQFPFRNFSEQILGLFSANKKKTKITKTCIKAFTSFMIVKIEDLCSMLNLMVAQGLCCILEMLNLMVAQLSSLFCKKKHYEED